MGNILISIQAPILKWRRALRTSWPLSSVCLPQSNSPQRKMQVIREALLRASNVHIPLINGVTRRFSRRARKTLEDYYFCFVTNSEPENLQAGSIGNKEPVTIAVLFALNYLGFKASFGQYYCQVNMAEH